MAKMNYSNFKEDGYEIIPAESVEVLPISTSYNLSNNYSNKNGQTIANILNPNPVGIISNCINSALDTVSTIGKCITFISVEKQKTKQIKATMEAKIVESKQQTKRLKIHEEEETKRLIVNCESDLKLKKLELEKLRDEYKFKSGEREISHKKFAKVLDFLEKQVDDLIKDKDLLRNIILEESDFSQIEIYLHSLNEANIKLIEISKQILSLKGIW